MNFYALDHHLIIWNMRKKYCKTCPKSVTVKLIVKGYSSLGGRFSGTLMSSYSGTLMSSYILSLKGGKFLKIHRAQILWESTVNCTMTFQLSELRLIRNWTDYANEANWFKNKETANQWFIACYVISSVEPGTVLKIVSSRFSLYCLLSTDNIFPVFLCLFLARPLSY